MVRIYPPPDDSADEIAREIAVEFWQPEGTAGGAVQKLAAALRQYGDAKLEEAAFALGSGDDGENEDWSRRGAAERVREFKSKCEDKP